MDKLKIYIDTSVISHLQHEDAPEKMKDTLLFWEELKTDKYEAIISELTLRELRRCPQPKQTYLLNFLGNIEYGVLNNSNEVEILAEAYVEEGILTRKNKNDCAHIALATVGGCNVIVSWNYKHMVRFKTIQGVRAVNAKKGYFKILDIVEPTLMIGDGADDRTKNQS
jgi:predicted nucleic acid-binding protein